MLHKTELCRKTVLILWKRIALQTMIGSLSPKKLETFEEKYSNIKPECKNCNFKEVQSIEKLQEHMKKTADPKPSKKTNTQSGTNQ